MGMGIVTELGMGRNGNWLRGNGREQECKKAISAHLYYTVVHFLYFVTVLPGLIELDGIWVISEIVAYIDCCHCCQVVFISANVVNKCSRNNCLLCRLALFNYLRSLFNPSKASFAACHLIFLSLAMIWTHCLLFCNPAHYLSTTQPSGHVMLLQCP